MRQMTEAQRKDFRKAHEADQLRRFRAAGMNETDAAAAAKKAVQRIELSESRRIARLDSNVATPAERLERRKELHMRNGMSMQEAEIAARGRNPAGSSLIDG